MPEEELSVLGPEEAKALLPNVDDEDSWAIIELTEDAELLPEEQTLMARIPLLAGSNKKVAYLGYRACGFTQGQACQLAGITKTTVHKWRKSDEVFSRWETEELARLQGSVGNDILKFEFMRNMRMLLKVDMLLIAKSFSGLENMTPREYELFKSLRKFYTPNDLLAIEKVISPEKHVVGPVVFQLSWGNRLETGQVVEGQYKELPNGEAEDSDM